MDEQELIQLEIAARNSSIEKSLLEEARIQREYAAMYHNVQRDINSFYGKYAIDEGVSYSEAKRRASVTDIMATESRIEKLLDAGLTERAMQEVRLLELTMTVNRLENLKADIGLSIVAGYDKLERQYGAILNERTVDEIERRAHELGLRQSKLNYDEIVRQPMGQANYLDRLWANQDYFRADIEKALKQAMIGGRSLDELAKEIKKKFGGAEYQAKRLLRTEIKRVETEVFRQLMLENGINYYKYETLDSEACEACRRLNGRRYRVDNMQIGVNAPPLHPNCRCSVIPWGSGWYKWNQNGQGSYQTEGKPLTHEQAAGHGGEYSRKVNPGYYKDKEKGYRHNCQTCVLVYDARRRGEYREALAFDPTNVVQDRLRKDVSIGWIGAKFEHSGCNNSTSMINYLNNNVKEGERYALKYTHTVAKDKNGANLYKGHVVCVERCDDGIRIYDAQTDETFTGVEAEGFVILEGMRYRHNGKDISPSLQRIDNLPIDETVLKAVSVEVK